ncbi:MAG: hypothetical protein IIY70_01720, partial [Oscillospiraceae bacterium]|nr:hypothetical protein [Oscillospiraceae bacterium]
PEDQSTGHTLREIADAIGVDKSTVFRYVQRCGIAPIDATQRCKRYSATAENEIIQHFATMRNDSKTMLGRLAMMRNSSGNDAHGLQRCSATTPDSSGELDRVTADRDKLAAERDALRDQLEGLRRDLTESRAKLEALTEERDRLRGELDRAAATVDQLRQDHRQQLDDLREDHRAELAAVRRGHAAELDRIQEAHRQQLEALRAELTEERQHSRDTAERLAQLADQAQRLQLAQMQPPAQIPERKPSLWARLFGKRKHDFDMEGGQDHSPN